MAEAAITMKAIALAVSPIITKLADNYFGGGGSTDMLRDLKTVTLPKIATVIEAAEAIPVHQLKLWLLELKAAAYEAEDVLDEYEYRCIQDQVSSYHIALKKFESKAKEFLGPISLKTKIRYKLEKLEKIASRVDEFISLEVLEGLKPPANLKDLAIEGYMGALSPSWMSYDLCLSNLQSLELVCCYNWFVLPPLGQLPLLGTLQISWATSVEEVGHEFYGSDDNVAFPSLKVLKLENMESWVRWSRVEDIDMFPSLHELVIDHCPKLMEVPCLPQSLKELQIKSCRNLTKVASLPRNLRKISIWGCHNLVQLSPFPSNLEKLYINGCPGVENLMSETSCGDEDEVKKQNTSSTCHLSLQVAISCNMKILKIPQKLISMFGLRVDGCPSLTTFILGHHLAALQKLFIGYCENLDSLVGVEALTCLRRLSVVSCPSLKMLRMQGHEDGGNLLPSSLVSIEIRQCDNMVNTLLKDCVCLILLSDLIIEDCPGLQSLENLCHLKALSTLCIRDCPDLTSVGNLKSLTSLKILGVFRCPKLATSCQVGKSILPSSITNLSIDHPPLLIELLQKEGMTALQTLFLAYLSQDTPFTTEQEEKFQYLTSLEYLCFYNCENLPSLPTNLKRLHSLKRLRLEYCPKIESLPELPHSLKILKIYRCHPQLMAQHQK